ncbi:hypothetical protein G7Y89_g2905 [Cudoniella acicularis]|uniref:Glucose-methanol-choline oxidoreductase N-terminal domain-containing protein n=1 Tax=Cudoniella acicularis TaxID=354080 RepID=A0A8H4RU85_9HELO|nr:hypothetical protein G7Y89_g2905 [Cudoniella acicularis]
MESIGFPLYPKGFSSGTLSGCGSWVTGEIKPEDATRSSSEAAYLRQAIANPNSQVTVYTHTHASKTLFDSSKNANGVLVITAVLEYTISAKKEVILSADVFHFPQLLMLSGVGQNFWDQIFFDVLSGVDLPVFIPTEEAESTSKTKKAPTAQQGPSSPLRRSLKA